MKKLFLILLAVSILSSACSWKPEVPSVPITAPWSEMNLPVKENAVVWKSEPEEFRAVHKEDKKTITSNYIDALKAQGWEVSNFDQSGDRYLIDMTKDTDQIHLEFYDFDNTGVVITRE